MKVIATVQLQALEWPQWSEYELMKGWLSPCGDPRPHRQLDDFDLVNPFARLGSLPLEGWGTAFREQFVNRFGLLGQTVLAGKSRRVRGQQRMGDNLVWAMAHARNVDRILRLHKGRFSDLDGLLESLAYRRVRTREIGQKEWLQNLHPMTIQVPILEEPWQVGIGRENLFPEGAASSPLSVQRLVIAQLLNPNIAGVNRRYDTTRGEPVFHCRALIEVIYWQLADRLGVCKVRRCECGALFFAADARQKFCPPIEGKKESACAKRFYMRRFRLRPRSTGQR
jgi:hypothetical protein